MVAGLKVASRYCFTGEVDALHASREYLRVRVLWVLL